MNKKFSPNPIGGIVIVVTYLLASFVGAMTLTILSITADMAVIWAILCWISTVFWMIGYVILSRSRLDVGVEGIRLFCDNFRLKKFEKFISWDDIYEIEIMKIHFTPSKMIYITKTPLSYGQKLFLDMKYNDCIIVQSSRETIVNEIKKYYRKEIIIGRSWKDDISAT